MIQQRGKRWRVVVQAGRAPLTGKRHQLSVSAPTEREAVKLERKLRLEAVAMINGRILVRELVEEWWASAPRLAPTTEANYKSNLDTHILPALGDKRVDEIRPRRCPPRGQLPDQTPQEARPRRWHAVRLAERSWAWQGRNPPGLVSHHRYRFRRWLETLTATGVDLNTNQLQAAVTLGMVATQLRRHTPIVF